MTGGESGETGERTMFRIMETTNPSVVTKAASSLILGNFPKTELASPKTLISGCGRALWNCVGAPALVCALVFALALSSRVAAQVAGATLSGTITDPSERSVPSARVDIENIATGVVHSATANGDGFYTVPNLTPGQYRVTVTADGFSTEVDPEITLTVGAERTLDFAMRVGKASIRVEVSTETPAVELNSSEISATVNETTIRELPLNGRSWTDLATLQPGVNAIQTQPTFAAGADRGNRGYGQQLTIDGARPQQNNYRLDGISLNDYANGAPGSVLGGNMG